MLQRLVLWFFPTIQRDLKKYPAIFAALSMALGITLYLHFPLRLPISSVLPLLTLPLILIIPLNWKYTLFILPGFLLLGSNEHKRMKIPSGRQTYTIRFHTPPLFQRGEVFCQKVSISESPSPVLTTVSPPLLPGESRVVTASYNSNNNQLTVDSTNSCHQKKFRKAIYKRVNHRLSQISSPMKSYYYALFLRERYRVDRTVVAIFEQSGLIHLMAISGLHISILGLILYYILYLIPLPRKWHLMSSALLSCTALLIIGPSPSTNRALIMFLSFAIAPLFQREKNNWNSLGIAALIILSFSPMDLFTAGFQLSFTATTAVLLALNISRKAKHRITKAVLFSCCSTFLIFVFTAPILLWHFNEVVPASLFYNIVALPLLSLTFTLMLISLTLSLIAPAIGMLGVHLISHIDLTLLNLVQQSIITLHAQSIKQLFSFHQIAGLAILHITALLYIKRKSTHALSYILVVIATLLILIPLQNRQECKSYIYEIQDKAFILIDLTRTYNQKELLIHIRKSTPQQIKAAHILCQSKDEAKIMRTIQDFMPKTQVYTTPITESFVERGTSCLSVGDTLKTPWGTYTVTQPTPGELQMHFLTPQQKDCFSYKVTLPLDTER